MDRDRQLVVVSASFTDDGAAAYLRADGSWTRALQEATPFDERAGEGWAARKAREDQRTVCDPYTFRIEVRDGHIDPLTTRERIRASGPSTRVRRPD